MHGLTMLPFLSVLLTAVQLNRQCAGFSGFKSSACELDILFRVYYFVSRRAVFNGFELYQSHLYLVAFSKQSVKASRCTRFRAQRCYNSKDVALHIRRLSTKHKWISVSLSKSKLYLLHNRERVCAAGVTSSHDPCTKAPSCTSKQSTVRQPPPRLILTSIQRVCGSFWLHQLHTRRCQICKRFDRSRGQFVILLPSLPERNGHRLVLSRTFQTDRIVQK